MHRAAQIIDAVVARLQASATLGVNAENVFAHRTLTLAADQAEMPALTVNFGDDEPDDEYTSLDGEIGSALQVLTKAYVIGDTEQAVKRALLSIRAETHKAIDLTETLDLDFVIKVEYAGADAPEIDTDGESPVGAQIARWLITYLMNPDDPS
jgi:hypothetical protein